jgi:LemA protein
MEVAMFPWVIGLLVLVTVWVVLAYNGLVRLRQHCRESWSGIDTELKRRYDLIPNLVETVKGYAAHEHETLAALTAARARAMASRGSPGSQAADEKHVVAGLDRVIALLERYPDLKASENFLALQLELAETEDRIQAARRFYNANVRDLNTRVEVFPTNFVAHLFSFQPEEFFEVEASRVRRVVPVTFEG